MNTTPNHSSMPQQEPETTQLSRGEFIRSLGMSSAALMAFYCMGTLTSCKGSTTDPAPAVITPGGTTGGGTNGVTGNASTGTGAINFTIDLANATFASLKTAGNFVNVGDVIVFNAAGTYKAVGRICTHASGNLSFRSANNDLICDNHQGLFNTDGSVKQSPPTVAVKSYSATLTADKLLVKA